MTECVFMLLLTLILQLVCPENVCLYCLLHIFKCTSDHFLIEAINMNPDQTAPRELSDLGPYCLQ